MYAGLRIHAHTHTHTHTHDGGCTVSCGPSCPGKRDTPHPTTNHGLSPPPPPPPPRTTQSTALLEAHARHAAPPERGKGTADQGWSGTTRPCGAGSMESPTRRPKRKPHDARFGPRKNLEVQPGQDRTHRDGLDHNRGSFPRLSLSISPLPHARHPTRCFQVRHDQPVSPLPPANHTHTQPRAPPPNPPLCLTPPPLFPIFSYSPTCANSSSTSEEVSRECSPVGRKARPRGGRGRVKEGSFAADVHASVARLRRSLPARLTNSPPPPLPPLNPHPPQNPGAPDLRTTPPVSLKKSHPTQRQDFLV